MKVSRGRAPWPENLNLRRLVSFPSAHTFTFALNQYLLDRGDARVRDFASLNANAKYYSDARRAAMENWASQTDVGAEGMSERIRMREVFRLVVLKVMRQNRVDVLVNPAFTIPQQKVHGAVEPGIAGRPGLPGSGQTPVLGVPEIDVPAGFNRIAYRTAVRPERGQEKLSRRHRLRPDVAATSHAHQHGVLGRAWRRAHAPEGGISL